MDPKKIIRRRKGEPLKPKSDASPSADEAPEEQPRARAAKKERRPPMDLSGLEELARGGGIDMASVMDEATPVRRRQDIGDRVQGTVTRVGSESLLVFIGAKMEATANLAEWPDAKEGDTVEAFIVDIHGDEIRLSKQLSGAAAATLLLTAHEEGIPVEGVVRSKNSGGFEVFIGKARAFCPLSQIHRLPGTDPEQWIGQTLTFKVIETGEKLVLSRRILQEEALEGARAAFWQSATIGATVEGVITSVQEWGAYVDLNGVEGRLHKRDMSWGGDIDPLGVFVRGQSISAQLHTLEAESQRVGLSMKDSADDPWQRAGVEFVVGAQYLGRVNHIEEFGAFVQLAPGLTGLVHVSKFRVRGKGLPTKGQELDVIVRSIDFERRRLDLGLPGEADTLEEQTVQGTVTEVMRNGVVVQLEGGGTGWLPSAEVDLPAGTVLAQRFRKGRAVTARILDAEGRRLVLTMKESNDQDSAWRSAAKPDQGSFGTFGDLFSALKEKK